MSIARPRTITGLCVLVGVLVSAGCAAPVRVHRADSRSVDRELTRSVTATGELSQDTHNVLHRWGMIEAYAARPDEVIDFLHRALVDGREGPDAAFALAELSFHHAERGHKGAGERWRRTGHYLAAAIYAYAYLFPDDPREAPNRLDPRVRRAADLYNRGFTLGLPSADDRSVAIGAGRFPLPFGRIDIAFDAAALRWGDRRLEGFVPAAELKVHGLTERYRRSGLGVPLAAGTKPLDSSKEPEDFIDPATRVPVTAILRIPEPRRQLARSEIHASLELYDATATEEVAIGGRNVPLEVEPTAAFAYMLAEQKFWDFELKSLLGTAVLGKDPMRLTAVQPWRRGRIPVVLVHGTGSSPGRWADMVNDLMDDPVIRDRFQFWFFTYDSGNPILYSAGGLRDLLTAAVERLDPTGADPTLRRMVVIGHSQGGLITKLTAVDSGDKLWGFRTRLDDMLISSKARELLRRLAFVKPLPFVKRVVFVATPHRGSYVAGNWMAHQFARLIAIPSKILDAGAEIAKGNPDLAEWRVPSAVENMTPGHPFVRALGPMPVDARIPCHSIVAVKTDPPYDGGTDGVVRYESAHRTDCASEVVVKSAHSCQSNPATIAEVRRILLLHLGDPSVSVPPVSAPRLPATPSGAP
ncbi:MAG: alpha/beta fold hydrolase [Deltaproteobacteria bacterium]|nr:alpha/beta fold hydrolase [Deltaproteobacteria bacterium]